MIPIEVLVGWGVTGAMIVGHVFVANYRIEKLEKEQEKHTLLDKEGFNEVWKWKNSHEKEAGNMREKYQNQLSELKGSILVTGEQFKQIMNILEDIKERITALENHKNNSHN